MIVVADTSPLNYLILIDQVDVLRTFFDRVLIPQAVYDELSSPYAPSTVSTWITYLPSWLEVADRRHILPRVDPRLHSGEREAISLAIEMQASALVIDETRGRREAVRHNLEVVGTLGVLERAHDAGLLDLRDALAKLQRTSFYLAPGIIANSLRQRY